MKRNEVGSSQLNTERSDHNNRVDRKYFAGNSKTAAWRRCRRNRAI